MYLAAIIDVYSRFIVGWSLANTLAAEASLGVIRQAVVEHGAPQILNSDQGCQFTCSPQYVTYLREQDIAISMDGKGRALDNFYIERFCRTIMYQHIFLNPADDGRQLYREIEKWLHRYHHRDHHRDHQGINRVKHIQRYRKAA